MSDTLSRRAAPRQLFRAASVVNGRGIEKPHGRAARKAFRAPGMSAVRLAMRAARGVTPYAHPLATRAARLDFGHI